MRVIKKYKNRKYYDMQERKYIRLEQLFTLEGEFKVIEQETGKNITILAMFDAAYMVERAAILAITEAS